jgi:penicillin-binding protein 2
MFRCWIYKSPVLGHTTHTKTLGHALSAPEGLMVSCNIYFFTMGQRLGPQGIAETYRMFGLGSPLDIGLDRPGAPPAVFAGYLGMRKNAGGEMVPSSAIEPGRIELHDAIQMGIGQGPVAWTPLHAADAYCTLARGGVRVRPHLVNEATSPETVDIGLDKRAVKEAMEGLWKSVNEDPGTGNHVTIDHKKITHFTAPNVVVWGKTGTAAAPSIYVRPTVRDRDGAEVPNPLWDKGVDAAAIAEASGNPEFKLPPGCRALRWGDHSWYVVLVGEKSENRPRYAIAVMMEYAGSGGKVSGPIVNQIIHALVAEGYL